MSDTVLVDCYLLDSSTKSRDRIATKFWIDRFSTYNIQGLYRSHIPDSTRIHNRREKWSYRVSSLDDKVRGWNDEPMGYYHLRQGPLLLLRVRETVVKYLGSSPEGFGPFLCRKSIEPNPEKLGINYDRM